MLITKGLLSKIKPRIISYCKIHVRTFNSPALSIPFKFLTLMSTVYRTKNLSFKY